MRAKITATVVQVTCPACRDAIPNPNTGSFMWDTNDFPISQIVDCQCGVRSQLKLPKTVQVA